MASNWTAAEALKQVSLEAAKHWDPHNPHQTIGAIVQRLCDNDQLRVTTTDAIRAAIAQSEGHATSIMAYESRADRARLQFVLGLAVSTIPKAKGIRIKPDNEIPTVQQRNTPKRALASLQATQAALRKTEETTPMNELININITLLRPSPANHRRDPSEELIAELAESIKTHGILEPILVREHPDDVELYEVIAGHRRLLAAQRAGLESVPAIVHVVSAEKALEMALVENLQREDVNALDEAEGLKGLIDAGKDVRQVASVIGKSQSYVYQRLKLLELIDPLKEMLRAGQISAAQAIPLARLDAEFQQDYADDPDLPQMSSRDIAEHCQEVEQHKEAFNKLVAENPELPIYDTAKLHEHGLQVCFYTDCEAATDAILHSFHRPQGYVGKVVDCEAYEAWREERQSSSSGSGQTLDEFKAKEATRNRNRKVLTLVEQELSELAAENAYRPVFLAAVACRLVDCTCNEDRAKKVVAFMGFERAKKERYMNVLRRVVPTLTELAQIQRLMVYLHYFSDFDRNSYSESDSQAVELAKLLKVDFQALKKKHAKALEAEELPV